MPKSAGRNEGQTEKETPPKTQARIATPAEIQSQVVVHQAPREWRGLAKASWILIVLACLLSTIPVFGFASWLIAGPVFIASLIMAIMILSRGGTAQGLSLLGVAMFAGPAFVVCAPFISSLLGLAGVGAALERHDQNSGVTMARQTAPPVAMQPSQSLTPSHPPSAATTESAPPAESDGRKVLEDIVQQNSNGLIRLTTFQKTDGVPGEVMGVKFYEMDYAGEIEYLENCMTSFNPYSGQPFYWLQAMAGRPEATLASQGKYFGLSPVSKGERSAWSGKLMFQKSENGWRFILNQSGSAAGLHTSKQGPATSAQEESMTQPQTNQPSVSAPTESPPTATANVETYGPNRKLNSFGMIQGKYVGQPTQQNLAHESNPNETIGVGSSTAYLLVNESGFSFTRHYDVKPTALGRSRGHTQRSWTVRWNGEIRPNDSGSFWFLPRNVSLVDKSPSSLPESATSLPGDQSSLATTKWIFTVSGNQLVGPSGATWNLDK